MKRAFPSAVWSFSLVAAALCAPGPVVAAVVGSTSVVLDAQVVDKHDPIAGQVVVSTAQAGELVVTIDWVDNHGRVADRQVSVIAAPGETSVPFSFSTDAGLTMLNRINASARFAGSGDTLSASSDDWELVPDPIDHEDFHANVWGSGTTSDPAYFSAIKRAGVDLGHIFRNLSVNDGYDFSGASFFGPLYDVRPNHDFIEDKRWFEMTDAMHDPNYNIYEPALSQTHDYYLPTKRSALVRPQSLSSTASLASLVSTITPRMQASRKWRPMQWNIADEYGLGRRDYPFDYDLGPDSIAQFIAWLQQEYGTIQAMNAQWGTSFTSFNDLSDPINAPRYGEAALIVTQEMKDREYPLYADDTAAKNFSPWSDFRRHMELTMADAIQVCVDAARAIDPTVPIGWEGGETVSPLNGYDYWLQMPKMASFEAYDLGNSPELARSFRDNQYGEKLYRWVTMFDSGSPQRNRYKLWFGFIHYGFRASIIWWYQNFFTGNFVPTGYAWGIEPAYTEFREGLAKLLSQGEQDDAEVALYYSQRSAHVSWMYDSEPYGYSWVAQKSNDRRLQTIPYVQTGWLKALEDVGVKGRFVSYEQVANGELITRGYKVLIMPRVMAMPPEEIAAVQAFAEAGGVVIADSQTALFDGHGKRRSIAEGGGLMDDWFGIERVNYRTTERNKGSSDAYPATFDLLIPAPPGYQVLLSGFGSTVGSGWHAVEDGVRTAGGTAVAVADGNMNQPVLIVRDHGAGKSVYMNLTLMRYGRTGSNYTDERRYPDRAGATAVRQLVRNLIALGGVAPKVQVLRGHDANPLSGTPVYNFEKSRFVDGPITYLGCVVNSQMENYDWSSHYDPAGALFGQAGATEANVTIVLDQPRHVYDVRQGTYMGYGAQVNAAQPVLEGGVFALLPYRAARLSVDSVAFDSRHRATVRASVRTDAALPGRHVLRLVVRDAAGEEVTYLTRNVIADGGIWEDVIPFAIDETPLSGWTITLKDMATGLSASVPAAPAYAGDINNDGAVNGVDLLRLAHSWTLSKGDAGYDDFCDLNADGIVNVKDLLTLALDFGR